jgi:hypothetical protein
VQQFWIPTLIWSASSGAASYDVYLGTSATPGLFANVTGTSYTPSTLLPNQTYYRQIVARNARGTNPSAVWSFTTTTAPTLAPTSVSPGAGSGFTQSFTFTFTDPAGYSDLTVLDVLINNYLDGIGACYFAWVPSGPSAGYVYVAEQPVFNQHRRKLGVRHREYSESESGYCVQGWIRGQPGLLSSGEE